MHQTTHQGRFFFAAALALATVSAQAANPPAPVDINLDFSKTADQAKVMLNGTAAFTNNRLELTNTGSQAGSAFLTTPIPATADYLATFQFEVMSDNGGTPADGFALVAQSVGADQVGDGGGNIGYASGSNVFGQNSYAVEFNDYPPNGFSDSAGATVAWDAFGKRFKYDQTAFPDPNGFVDQGVFTAEVRVQPNNITVTVSGGKSNLKPTVAMKTDFLSLFATPPPPLFQNLAAKPLFLGFTGGTGGSDSIQDILNLHIQSPAPAATAGP